MSNLPPPLPPGGQTPPPPIPAHNNAVIPGTEGMTIEQLEEEVRNGGRFVFYSYAISIVFMTFKRSSSVRFLKRGQDGTGAAFGYSLLSFLLGWWGIPWGPIYTIGALIQNARGGKDVTLQVMAALTNQVRATQTFSERRKPAAAGLGMILFRAALIAAPVAIIFSIVKAVNDDNVAEDSRRKKPGYAAYDKVNNNVSLNVTGGNSTETTVMAREISAAMKKILESTVESKRSGKLPDLNSSVWCDTDANRCVILMKMTDLSKFDQESQTSIAEALWALGQHQLKEKNLGTPGMTLVTGLRGRALYDSVMVGRYHPDGENQPDETLKHSDGVDKLVSMFESQPPAPAIP